MLGYELSVSDNLLISSDKDVRIASLEALLAERDTALAQAKAELLHRDLLIETMRVQLARLRRMQFGASSEKLSAEIAQLALEAKAVEVTQTSSLPPRPERPTPVRALPEHLPREDVVAEPSSGTCACPDYANGHAFTPAPRTGSALSSSGQRGRGEKSRLSF